MCGSSPDGVDVLVDQVVPADASCWSTFDPATTMLTSAVGRNLDEESDDAVRFMELEYVTAAPGHYRELTSSAEGVVVWNATSSGPVSAEVAPDRRTPGGHGAGSGA